MRTRPALVLASLALALVLALPAAGPAAAAGPGISVLDLLELEVSYDTLTQQYYRRVSPQQVADGARTGIVSYLAGHGVRDPRVGYLRPGLRAIESALAAAILRYPRAVRTRALVYATIAGELATVHDTYTTFFTPKAFQAFNAYLDAPRFGGIGAVLDEDPATHEPRVDDVIPGSPAERAGVQPGDDVVAIDDRPTANVSLDAVSALLRGKPGTAVGLRIARDGAALPRLSIVRAIVDPPTVYPRLLPGGIGYAKLTVFGGKSGEELRAALVRLGAQGARAFVLDLRDNGGGYRDTAVKVASTFVARGPIVTVEERGGHRTTFSADGSALPVTPLVVLVDGNTASASEIVAGAIQDDRRGTIVGERTFGKGVVQSVFPLPDGSAMKVTTGRYFTAGGRDINGIGITPDVTVAEPSSARPGDPSDDPQLDRARAILEADLRSESAAANR